MNSLVLTLDPEKLRNPDLDLRYVVPDLLTVRSNGNVRENGYDYEESENPDSPLLAIFLTATDLPSALECIGRVVLHEEVMENDLSCAAILYIENEGVRSQISFGGSHA